MSEQSFDPLVEGARIAGATAATEFLGPEAAPIGGGIATDLAVGAEQVAGQLWNDFTGATPGASGDYENSGDSGD